MLTNRRLLNVLIDMSLFLGVVASPAVAVQTPESSPNQVAQVPHIESPQPSQINLALGGCALIGLLIAMAKT